MSTSVSPPDVTTDIDHLEKLWEMPSFEEDKGWELIFLDDDVSPMEYVALLFMEVFEMSPERAVEVMLRIHNHGRGSVFRGSYEECKEKQDAANAWQRQIKMNVFSVIEKVGD